MTIHYSAEGYMTETQHLTLFVVFVAFFVVIGIIALLAITGVVSTDKEFHRWSVAGVAAAVVGVLVIWTKSSPPCTTC
jgi:uncharacterized membrane protein HdeD (DUF308 family)